MSVGLPSRRRAAEIRLVGRHALTDVAFGEQLQVRVNLQPGVLVQTPARQHEQEPRDAGAEAHPHVTAFRAAKASDQAREPIPGLHLTGQLT